MKQTVGVDRDITALPRVVAAPAGKPVRPEANDNQRLMSQIVRDPSSWTPELAAFTTQVFDAMAENWADERGGYRAGPVTDALVRGGPFPVGPCLEIGSGSGVLTPSLQIVWREIVCLDLSMEMLRLQGSGCRVRADASKLPFSDQSFDVVVIGDAPLFASEVVRVLSSNGSVVWSNALGSGAPYYLPTLDIWDAMIRADPKSSWSAVESEALWGTWLVLHRA
jgi:methyltransferase family protein